MTLHTSHNGLDVLLYMDGGMDGTDRNKTHRHHCVTMSYDDMRWHHGVLGVWRGWTDGDVPGDIRSMLSLAFCNI